MLDIFFQNFRFREFRKLPFFEFRNISEIFWAFRTRSDPNFCEKIAKIRVRTSQNKPFTEITENNEKMTFNLSRLDSRKLVPTRIPTRIFEFEFGMQGPKFDLLSILSTLNARILHTKVLFGSFFYLHVTAKKMLVQKMRS